MFRVLGDIELWRNLYTNYLLEFAWVCHNLGQSNLCIVIYINWIIHFFAEKITVCLAKVSKHELAFLARIFCDLPWEFDQKSYSEDFPGNGGLDTSGYIYVPTKCQWANCNLLLFLHGCIGAKEYVGDKVIVQAGFLEGILCSI